MNNRLLNTLLFAASSTLLLAGCGEDNSSYETPNTSGVSTNPGIISQKNFSLLTADINPAVLDATTGVFTKTDVELTIYIGDRNNQTLTDAHTIHFEAEYGLIEPSCVTENGSCSVTWSAIKRPIAGGPGSDGFVSITAYTIGEEGFTDTNGNGIYDDADAGFDDLEEPYVDANESFAFNIGDGIIDVVSTNDPTGVNNTHDDADGFFNGPNCLHSSLCGTPSITIFDGIIMNLTTNVPLERTIGGNVTGLAGSGLELQNNGETLLISGDGAYTFVNTVTDGSGYAVSVLTQPSTPGQVCTPVNENGTASANVTNVDITCVTNTFTIGGSVNNLSGDGLVLQNNFGDDLTVLSDTTSYEFATPIDDSTPYEVTVLTDPSAPNQICEIPVNASAPSISADVIDADVSCTTIQYSFGGTISGITDGILTIVDGNGNSLPFTADDTYAFPAIDDGTTYSVTITTTPTTNSNCTFTNAPASADIAGDNVVNVDITCALP